MIPGSFGMESVQDLLNVAIEAARAGAAHIVEGYGRVLDVKQKGPNEFVTQYKIDAEEIIRKIIKKSFSGHSFLAEEGGLQEANSPYRWYIDPLDGTINYTRSHPFFAVSVACCAIIPGRAPKPLAGVLVAPVLRESYWAYEGGGAFRGQEIPGRGYIEEKIKVSNVSNATEALVCTGIPDYIKRTEPIMAPIRKIMPKIKTLRRDGAAALDMAYVASGRADGYFEIGTKAWDLAAGLLLVAEAGGTITDLAGEPYVLEKSDSVLTANPLFHPTLVKILK
ncbi:MAG: inositol monophosphatase [Deltaproteobacteria bacterium]|jgi:myo-inositol-1(or 4)-monophosphatase|nr:inositol monophosphatase [Deltaproteobacteria bacterium]